MSAQPTHPTAGRSSRPDVARVEERDVVGVGLGPFNLGLAALLDPVPEIDAVFLEARPTFSWHPGLLLDGTTLQVPFLADLVTLADPTSPYSFLNYLQRHGRLYRFYFYERFHVPRQEYDHYCRWVAEHLPSCRFGQRVVGITPLPDGRWSVLAAGGDDAGAGGTPLAPASRPVDGNGSGGRPGAKQRDVDVLGRGAGPGVEPATDVSSGDGRSNGSGSGTGRLVEYRARAVVLGVGSTPSVPQCVREHLGETVFHSAEYLARRDRALAAPSATVIGSGQSAAEVFADLLSNGPGRAGEETDRPTRLDWFTRSRGFLPMEYSKLGLEHFTPEYTAYFHGLSEERRDGLRAGQDLLYKGISSETSELIYDTLYEASIGGREPNVGYRSACELRALDPVPGSGPAWRLTLHHLDEDVTFHHSTDVVVLATGYAPAPLPLSPQLAELVVRDGQGRPVIDLDYRVRLADRRPVESTLFVQNAELHTHGVGAPDLGLGAHRNSVLVNALAGREVYPVRARNVFQSFGAPPPSDRPPDLPEPTERAAAQPTPGGAP